MLSISLLVHRLKLYASNSGGPGSIPGWEIKSPYVEAAGHKTKEKNRNRKVSYKENRLNLLLTSVCKV